MNRSSEKGIALVITLIMLSLVTLMAVVFLSISRREKASVTVRADMAHAELMADAALARAEGELISRIIATTNIYNYDLTVSTNFINPFGFRAGVVNPTNVSYTYGNGTALNSNDRLQNIANLQLDPRPPVFVPVGTNIDFRFYLDFNRNGRFETNGWRITRTPSEKIETNFFVGDPEWVGILEHPDRPHSESNRFVGRIAYIVLPTGKSLDVNFLHNNAKFPGDAVLTRSGFLRNEGFGAWELNLASFLADLNVNIWPPGYRYFANTTTPNQGVAFLDAQTLLNYRHFGQRLLSVSTLFGARGTIAFQQHGLDGYADGPLLLASTRANFQGAFADDPTRPWSGADSARGYYDVQELFHPEKTSAGFTNRLRMPMAISQADYDRYTFYRLLAQLGVDSRPAESNRVFQATVWPGWTNRINLNYKNEYPNGQTNFLPWNDGEFFELAADRLLRSTILPFVSRRLGPGTNYLMGEGLVRPTFKLRDIQIYHLPQPGLPIGTTNNEYSATVHRLLQLAANIYEANTTNVINQAGTPFPFPSVFRPVFYKTATNLVIAGYVPEHNANFIANTWVEPEQVMRLPRSNVLLTNLNVYGVPVIIGARKFLPNFNEYTVQSTIQVSRKLEVLKPSTDAPPPWQTNQMYVVGISNLFGVEGWNSYTEDFRHPFELRITNRYTIALSNTFPNGITRAVAITNGMVSKIVDGTVWSNRLSRDAFQLATTNLVFLQDMTFSDRFPFLRPATSNNFENAFYLPQLTYYITNRMTYILLDKSAIPYRVIDLVNLDKMVVSMDITAKLLGDTNSVGGRIIGGGLRPGLSPGVFWDPRRVGRGNSVLFPTVGVTNQIGAALGDPALSDAQWRSWNGNTVSGLDKDRSIDTFRVFMGLRRLTNSKLPPPSAAMEVPFTPTRVLVQRSSWQANDPLIHYTADDLSDPILTDPNNENNFKVLIPGEPAPSSNLGRMNERYRPWGGNPNLNASGATSDRTAYDLAFKDPGVKQSDDWDFPTNKYPNIGWLGRVHRGSPWQTVYLKSRMAEPKAWGSWAGSLGTHPTNDWKLMDIFTVAPNANAARGLLAVNQTNIAAWSAVLGSVAVLSNNVPNASLQPKTAPRFSDLFIQPNSAELRRIVGGIMRTKDRQPKKVFESMGAILATPELSDQSPFLNLSGQQALFGLTDAACERIPQQILSLLKPDETRVVIYGFGQSLKPADRSLVTSGKFYNLCTNYQITGEAMSKAVLRIEPVITSTNRFRAVVESYSVLPLD